MIEKRLWFEGYFQSPCFSARLIPVSLAGLEAEEESVSIPSEAIDNDDGRPKQPWRSGPPAPTALARYPLFLQRLSQLCGSGNNQRTKGTNPAFVKLTG